MVIVTRQGAMLILGQDLDHDSGIPLQASTGDQDHVSKPRKNDGAPTQNDALDFQTSRPARNFDRASYG